MDDLETQQATSSMLRQALCIISKPFVIQTRITVRKRQNSGQNRRFFLSRVTLKCDVDDIDDLEIH